AAALTPKWRANSGIPGATIPYPSATVNETALRIATSRGRSAKIPRRERGTTRHSASRKGLALSPVLAWPSPPGPDLDHGAEPWHPRFADGIDAPAPPGATVRLCWDTGNVLGLGRNTLVGREAELSHLLAVLESASEGRPIVTLISGDAGVG